MSFTPRTKPNTSFKDMFKPSDNPTWDSLDTYTWNQMIYSWDFFNSLVTYTKRIKPNTIFNNI
jgi:hypothetical protein